MNRQRQKVFMTGTNGSDDVGTISDMAGTASNGNYSNVYQGGMEGSTFIGLPNYDNPNNVLHNNVGSRVMLEQMFDNKLFIDSSFKDYSKNPELFKFVVKFNGTNPTTENVSISINVGGAVEQFSYTKYISGDTDVVLDRTFKNIKYVVVNALILPNYINYRTADDGSYQPDGRKLAKSSYKYIVLKINEIRNGRYHSNNPALGRESFVMKMDTDIAQNNQIWIPIHNNVGYFDSQLKKFDRLTVEICDDKGNRLCTKLDGRNFDFFAEYRRVIDHIIRLRGSVGRSSAETEKQIERLIPKLRSLQDIVESVSPELHLTLNTVEPQIDTKPQFRY
jgi:hypothetical protein